MSKLAVIFSRLLSVLLAVLAAGLLALLAMEAVSGTKPSILPFLVIGHTILHLMMLAWLLWKRGHARRWRLLSGIMALAIAVIAAVRVQADFSMMEGLFYIYAAVLVVPGILYAAIGMLPASGVRPASDETRAPFQGGMPAWVKGAGLMVLGGLAVQGVLSMLSDDGAAGVPVAAMPTAVAPAPQPKLDLGVRYSVMSRDSQKFRLHTGSTRNEAYEDLCPGCKVVAEGEGRCGAFLEFLLPWNAPIYAIARSTAEAEERVIRICQMRDAASRDCTGVRSFCGGD